MSTKRAGIIVAWLFVGVSFLGQVGGWDAVLIAAIGVLILEYFNAIF